MLWVEDFIDLSVLFKVENKSSLAVIRQNKEILRFPGGVCQSG